MRDYELNESTIIKKHKNNQRYVTVLVLLSVMVAAVVGVSLIKPAESMTYSCGLEEHTHSEDCYSLVCTEDTQPHIHSAECYPEGDTSLEPACVIGEGTVSHVHTAECYEIICDIPEHIHGADCQTAASGTEKISETTAPENIEPALETAVSEEITTAETEISVSETAVTPVSSTALKVERHSYNSDTDEFSWTLVFRHDGTALDGYEISDNKLLKNVLKLEIYDETNTLLDTFDDENPLGTDTEGTLGTLARTEGKFTFAPGQCGTEYKFVYTIKAEKNFVRGIELINKTVLRNGSGETVETSEDTFSIPVQVALGASDKYTVGAGNVRVSLKEEQQDLYDYDRDDNCKFEWTVAATGDAGLFNNKFLRSVLSTQAPSDKACNYVTPDFRNRLLITAYDASDVLVTLAKDSDYILKWYDASGNEISSDDTTTNAFKFIIKFTNTAEVSSVVKINIDFASLINTEPHRTSDNDITVKVESTLYHIDESNSEVAEAEGGFSPTVPKKYRYKLLDYNNGAADESTSTSHKINELSKTADGKYILSWEIYGNYWLKYAADDQVTYKNTLPNGVKLIESSLKLKDEYNGQIEVLPGSDWSYTLTTDAGGQQVIDFVVENTRHADKFYIFYNVEIDPEYFAANFVPSDGGGVISYQNVIKDTRYNYSQTQTITAPLISKTAPDNFPDDNYMTYELDINPYSGTINAGNNIKVEDKFSNVTSGVVPIRNTMEVYEVDAVGTEKLLTNSDYRYTYSGSGSNSKFTLILKDSTHYKIKYKYHIIFTQDVNFFYLKNTATLTYGSYSHSAVCDKSYSVTRTKTSWNPSIENVDATNHSIKLENGIFNIYKFDNSSRSWLPLTNAASMTDSSGNTVLSSHTWGNSSDTPKGLATNDKGKIALGSLDSGYIYKLVQVASKEGYSFPKTPYYFADYIGSNNYDYSGNSLSGLLDGSIQILGENGSLIVENRIIEKTEISVNKIWQDGLSSHPDLPVNLKLHQSAIAPDGSLSGGQQITVHFLAYVKESGRLMSDITRSFYMKTGSDLGVTLRMYNAWIQPYQQGQVPCSVTINGESIGIFSDAFKKISTQDAWNIQTVRPNDWYNNPDFYTEYQVNYSCVTGPLYIEVICGESMEENPLCGLETADFRIFDNGIMVGEAIDGIPSDAKPVGDIILNDANNWTHTWNKIPLTDSSGNPLTDEQGNQLYGDLPKTDEYGNLLYYYVEETSVPPGYSVKYVNNGINSGMVKIVNKADDYIAVIPSTGGEGTGKYIAVGFTAASCSAIVFLLKRRVRRRKSL